MSKEARNKLINAIYDVLEIEVKNLSPSEIYGSLETVKMDIHDKAVKAIKENKIWWKI